MPELWDLYDENRKPLGKTHVRSEPLNKGEYHLVIEVWTITPDGKILIDKRHPNKARGGLWECTGGAVVAGEDSITATLRELEEEIGIKAAHEELILINSVRSEDNVFIDTYIIIKDVNISTLVLQEEEVTEAKLITLAELDKLFSENLLVMYNERYKINRDIIAQYAMP